jgi:hypothetical protein
MMLYMHSLYIYIYIYIYDDDDDKKLVASCTGSSNIHYFVGRILISLSLL